MPIFIKVKIIYNFNKIDGIGDYIYSPGHPMKPQRIKLTHHLLLSYNLYHKMEVYVFILYIATT